MERGEEGKSGRNRRRETRIESDENALNDSGFFFLGGGGGMGE